jgi:hypothetical protein
MKWWQKLLEMIQLCQCKLQTLIKYGSITYTHKLKEEKKNISDHTLSMLDAQINPNPFAILKKEVMVLLMN